MIVTLPDYTSLSIDDLKALRNRMRTRLSINANPARFVRLDLNLLPVYTQILEAVEAELVRRTGDNS